MKLINLIPVITAGILGDVGVNEYVIDAVFVLDGKEKEIRISVQDMDYNGIDFNDVNSITDCMRDDAYNKAYVEYACYFIDDEVIDGEIGVDMEVSSPEGDMFNIFYYDVSQLRDILGIMPKSKKGVLCKELLENRGLI